MKREHNPYRAKMNQAAKMLGICTQCFSRPTIKDRVQCKYCIDLNYRKRKAKENQ